MICCNRLLASAALALTLAACGGGDKETAKGTAGGEILPGSASDAMLPLDTVRSQPPLAPKSEGSPSAKPSDKPRTSTRAARPEAAEPEAPEESPPEPAAEDE